MKTYTSYTTYKSTTVVAIHLLPPRSALRPLVDTRGKAEYKLNDLAAQEPP